MLDDQERSLRTNHFHDGRAFQDEIKLTAGAYCTRRIAKLEKIDPPVRVMGGGNNRRVIFLSNPFLDFFGTWTAKGGRTILVEAKSTGTHRLPLVRNGGLSATQWAAMQSWGHMGAACALLWQFNGGVRLWTPLMLQGVLAAGEKSVKHETGAPVHRGPGALIWDFLPVLEERLGA